MRVNVCSCVSVSVKVKQNMEFILWIRNAAYLPKYTHTLFTHTELNVMLRTRIVSSADVDSIVLDSYHSMCSRYGSLFFPWYRTIYFWLTKKTQHRIFWHSLPARRLSIALLPAPRYPLLSISRQYFSDWNYIIWNSWRFSSSPSLLWNLWRMEFYTR